MCFTLYLSLISSSRISKFEPLGSDGLKQERLSTYIQAECLNSESLFVFLPFFVVANIIVPLELTQLRRSCI